MGRAFIGFLTGFCLAVLLFSTYTYVSFSPLESDITTAMPVAQSVFDASHSTLYVQAETTLGQISQLASSAASIPGIGVIATSISNGLGLITQLLSGTRSLSEKLLPLLQNVLLLIQVSLPAMVLSFLGLLAGIITLSKTAPDSLATNLAATSNQEPNPTTNSGRTCLKCGAHWPKDATFCGECGGKLGKK